MTVLGLAIALPAEGRALMGERGWRAENGGRICRRPFPGGGTVFARQQGIGPQAALESARRLVWEGATVLGSLGVGGGLQPRLGPGTAVIAESVVDLRGEILPCDPMYAEWIGQCLKQADVPFLHGRICSVDRPALTSEEKAELHRRFAAMIVDMESAAIALAAREAAIPFFCLRTVCDPAERTLSEDLLQLLSESGSVNIRTVLSRLARRPSLGVDLMHAAKDYTAALGALKRGWRSCLKIPLGPTAPDETLRNECRSGGFGLFI